MSLHNYGRVSRRPARVGSLIIRSISSILEDVLEQPVSLARVHVSKDLCNVTIEANSPFSSFETIKIIRKIDNILADHDSMSENRELEKKSEVLLNKIFIQHLNKITPIVRHKLAVQANLRKTPELIFRLFDLAREEDFLRELSKNTF